MKPLIPLTLILFISLSIAYSQTITNVIAKQNGNNIDITYDLQSNDNVGINLYVSEKGNNTFTGPLRGVSGDVGYSIAPGNNKTITWKVLQDQEMLTGDNIVVRVAANKKSGSFTDSRNGKSYKTIRISKQTMMAENLAYKPDRGNYWTYNDDMRHVATYGYLYDWETAKTVCPSGWHLPSNEEFETLLQNVGSSGENAAKALVPSGNSGFAALFGGCRNYGGNYNNLDAYAYFWSSSPLSDDDACNLSMYSSSAYVGNNYRVCGFSVRCFRD